MRAITVHTNTIAMSVSAMPHARSCAAGNGVCALNQISCDSVVFVPWNGLEFDVVRDADREQQRRGLARGARDREHGAADDARDRGREHDGHDRAPAARAERVARLPQVVRARASASPRDDRITIGSIRHASASDPAKPE